MRSELGISPTAFVFGSVGRLAPEKNQGVLIDALAELRARGVDAHLLLVGDGSRRSSLEELVKARGMSEHATFAGSQRDVRPFLSAMDVFVLPSSHVETFSNAALEAMSMSRAVVLSRIGGAAEMVGDGIEGFTLQVDSLARELPHVLRRLHDDPELRARLGRAARERVESRFSLCKMVDDFCALTAAARRDTGVS